jgi:hypothetical protein
MGFLVPKLFGDADLEGCLESLGKFEVGSRDLLGLGAKFARLLVEARTNGLVDSCQLDAFGMERVEPVVLFEARIEDTHFLPASRECLLDLWRQPGNRARQRVTRSLLAWESSFYLIFGRVAGGQQ